MLQPQKDMNISDAKVECGCELGIKFSSKDQLIPGTEGNFWLIKHYNYNNRPIYYNYDTSSKRDLYLYFGSINVYGKEKGWIIDHDFGWLNESPPILFHETTDDLTCPENVGMNWENKNKRYLLGVEAICL